MSHSPGLPSTWDYRHDRTFTPPPRVPWSKLAPQFALAWGNANPDDPQPENMEIFGQNGSGKTHLLGKIYQEQAYVNEDRARIIIATKTGDKIIGQIGFTVVSSWDELVRKFRDGHRSFVFWPRTRTMGNARKSYHNDRITGLLDRLWVPGSDTDIAIDDMGYAEKLPDVKDRIEQYLREGRSTGLSTTVMKQRPQGSTRLVQSETHWTVGFKPKHRQDLEWWAELFGAKRDWMPVFDGMDDMKREFVIRHNRSGLAYISWVDTPLEPRELPQQRATITQFIGGRRNG
jgi:hypothetical protein